MSELIRLFDFFKFSKTAPHGRFAKLRGSLTHTPEGKELWRPLLIGLWGMFLLACQAKPQIEEQFSLKDLTPPQVISILPENGATEVTDKPTIVVVFNEPMDAATLNSSTVTVKTGNGTPGVGSYEYDATNYALTIKIVQNLYLNTQYTITVTDNVKDKAGNAIVPVTSIFSTDVCPKAKKSRPVFDSDIFAIAKVGCTLFVGGIFQNVGEASSYGIALDAVTGEKAPSFTYEDIDGYVFAAAPDGQGGFYIGGNFTRVGNYTRNRLAHIAANGEVLPWNPGANNIVRALAVSGTTIYVGGEFTTTGGVNRNRLAAISTDGTLLNWNPGANDKIFALAVSSGVVYAGGDFSEIAGNSRSGLAAIGSDGNLYHWNPNITSSGYMRVMALSTSGSTLYVGGYFDTVSGNSRNNLAAIDIGNSCLTNYSPASCLFSWNPNANNSVRALAVSGTTIYVGGDFTSIGASTRNRLAAIDIVASCLTSYTAGCLLSWNPDANDNVEALAISGSTVYVGGDFTQIGTQSRKGLAAINTSGTLLSWNPKPGGLAPHVNAIVAAGTTVYAGGYFTIMGAKPRNGLAALSTDGTLLNWNPNVAGGYSIVYTMAVSGNTLYAGGDFTTVDAVTRNRAAAVDIGTSCLTNYTPASCLLSWDPNANSDVYALAVSGSTVYAGGQFMNIGGQPRNRLAALNNTTGSATGWDPNADGGVFAILPSGSTIYAGGAFNNIGGQARKALAALDAASGSALSWNPDSSAVVYALSLSGTTLYAGGGFTTIGGNSRNRLAAIETGGSCLASYTASCLLSWNPAVDSGVVYALAILGTTIYAGGNFVSIGGTPRENLAAFGTDGALLPWQPNANSVINALLYSNSTVYVGGNFTSVGSNSHHRLASINTDGSVNW